MSPAIPRARRLLVIGLDAGEWSLIRRWAAAGKMPVMRRLLADGCHGTLEGTAGQLPDTVWSCIYTGSNPATFEKYFYVQYDPATGDLKHLADDAIQQAPFWDVLARAGRKVGVFDPVKFKVSREPNVFQVANWGAHATKTARASNPPELLDALNQRCGAHPVGDCDAVDPKPESQRRLVERVLDGVARRGDAAVWLLRERPWDVFFAAFSETHCIGHHFWHFLDPDHPRHGEADPAGLGDAIERTYVAIDREIGRMIEAAGPGAAVMVLAGHGMGPLFNASWHLPEILDRLGFGRPGAPAPAAAKDATAKASVNPWRVLKMVLPGRLQYAIKNALPKRLQDELLFRWYAGRRDWKGRRAFAVPNNDSVGAIRVAVKGRDRHGVVEPGAEHRALCEELVAALRELVDPVSGRPVVREATILRDRYHGPFLEGLPDVTVLWETSFAWRALRSPRLGTLELTLQDGRTGSHTPRGFFVVAGEGIPAGVERPGHHIVDVAPTILALSGVDAPRTWDGRPIPLAASPVPA